jgi:acylglycerol lipase
VLASFMTSRSLNDPDIRVKPVDGILQMPYYSKCFALFSLCKGDPLGLCFSVNSPMRSTNHPIQNQPQVAAAFRTPTLNLALHSRLCALISLLAVPAITQCGGLPGPGPTSAQIKDRTSSVEVAVFRSNDNKELAYILHRPHRPHPRRAAFIYLHGIESHSGWFDAAAGKIAAHGYPVICLDRRGSGINRENRGHVSGHVQRGTSLVEDIHSAVHIAKSSGKIDEIYLIGLSWGGKYAMAYDAIHPDEVNGMILITPGMKPRIDLCPLEKAAVFTDVLFAPQRQHRIPIEPEMFTADPDQLRYIRNDPLKLHTASAGFMWESLRMDKLVATMSDGKHPPMLVFLAAKDRIIDNEATREFVTRDPKRAVKIIEYADQTHSIQLDAPDRLARDIFGWIDTLPDTN